MSLFIYPIVTRIVHNRVALRKDFSALHPTGRFSQISCFFVFICSRHFSGQESLQFFHSMDPYKAQLNQADDQYTAGPGSDTDMHVMYVLHSNQRSKD